LPGAQAAARQVNGNERCRAGSLHCEAGAAEAELVGDAGGEEVLVGGEHGGTVEGLVGPRQRVGAETGANEHSDPLACAAGITARVLQGLPGALEEDPVLRIGDLGLARSHAEQPVVEAVDVVEPPEYRHEALLSIRGRGLPWSVAGQSLPAG